MSEQISKNQRKQISGRPRITKEEKPSSQNLTLHETKPPMKANDALKQKRKK